VYDPLAQHPRSYDTDPDGGGSRSVKQRERRVGDPSDQPVGPAPTLGRQAGFGKFRSITRTDRDHFTSDH
jgi:hypothetical protein